MNENVAEEAVDGALRECCLAPLAGETDIEEGEGPRLLRRQGEMKPDTGWRLPRFRPLEAERAALLDEGGR